MTPTCARFCRRTRGIRGGCWRLHRCALASETSPRSPEGVEACLSSKSLDERHGRAVKRPSTRLDAVTFGVCRGLFARLYKQVNKTQTIQEGWCINGQLYDDIQGCYDEANTVQDPGALVYFYERAC